MKELELIHDWKDIVGYEGLYKISNYGKVFNCTSNKILKADKGNRGYTIKLLKDGKCKHLSIARLVAQHFVNNPYNYDKIYFIDGNKYNIKYNNIQWGTTARDTKIVVDGIIFNSLKDYKEFCKRNEQVQYLMDLEERCDIQMPTLQEINAEFKI